MKKVLLGLVIAVMMTGSGYAKNIPNDHCDWLLNFAKYNVDLAKFNAEENDYEWQEKHMIKAEQYAVTWSALCD